MTSVTMWWLITLSVLSTLNLCGMALLFIGYIIKVDGEGEENLRVITRIWARVHEVEDRVEDCERRMNESGPW